MLENRGHSTQWAPTTNAVTLPQAHPYLLPSHVVTSVTTLLVLGAS